MTVNWTPFLTLFPLRFPPANDIFGFCSACGYTKRESASSEFRCPSRLRSRLKQTDGLTSDFQTPSSRSRITLTSATTASSVTLALGCMFVALCRLSSRSSRPRGATRSLATRKAFTMVKTKKKFSELPRVKLLADGTVATPLEPFDGGLGIKKSTRRRSSAPFRLDTRNCV